MSTTHHVFTNQNMPQILPSGCVLVPQMVYVPEHSATGFRPRVPIRFECNGSPGIRLDRAFRGEIFGMNDANVVEYTTTTSQKIGLRINWPGYSSWFKHFIVSSSAGHYTKGRLAREFARHIQQFLTDMASVPPTKDARDWKVSHLRLEDLILLELHHVSQGSWQAVLCRIVQH